MAIDQLFGHGGLHTGHSKSSIAFPIRAIWRHNPRRSSDAPIQFLVSVPKKRLRHAVDRVTMRRRIREAFRLLRHQYPMPSDARVDVVFLYVANELMPYTRVENSMRRLLDKIASSATVLIASSSSLPDEPCE